jgi:hypothetical protein
MKITVTNNLFPATTNGVDTKSALQAAVINWALNNADTRIAASTKIEMANILFPELPKMFVYLFGETITIRTKEGDVVKNVSELDMKKNAACWRVVDHKVRVPVKKHNGKIMTDFYVWGEKMLAKNLKNAVDFGYASEDAKARLEAFVETIVEEDREIFVDWFKAFPLNFKFVLTPEEQKLVIPVTQELIDTFGEYMINNWQEANDDGTYPACHIAIGDMLIFDQAKDGSWAVYVCEEDAYNSTYKHRDTNIASELIEKGIQ